MTTTDTASTIEELESVLTEATRAYIAQVDAGYADPRVNAGLLQVMSFIEKRLRELEA